MAETEPITLRLPSKYANGKVQDSEAHPPPPVDWLLRSWSVTHSTLSMWRSARNVRISYAEMAPAGDGTPRIDDLVEYEPLDKTGVLKNVTGVDTQDPKSGWNWRGKGWLFFVTSHWEVIGWGEAKTPDGTVEKWAVTWFAPTFFTKEGLDIYCDQKQGISESTFGKIMEGLKGLEASALVSMVEKDMRPVEIKLPWVESSKK
ncbi:unnamed protein product [Clonostachys byssicola]|uniref:Uncharacterized protein n=1 Tax=Clonostachys byssicola TaxID=160290 RepID=A0A9N9U8T2_9HYPO|nr:unnamed protein product [Clonostachys byssicola]